MVSIRIRIARGLRALIHLLSLSINLLYLNSLTSPAALLLRRLHCVIVAHTRVFPYSPDSPDLNKRKRNPRPYFSNQETWHREDRSALPKGRSLELQALDANTPELASAVVAFRLASRLKYIFSSRSHTEYEPRIIFHLYRLYLPIAVPVYTHLLNLSHQQFYWFPTA